MLATITIITGIDFSLYGLTTTATLWLLLCPTIWTNKLTIHYTSVRPAIAFTTQGAHAKSICKTIHAPEAMLGIGHQVGIHLNLARCTISFNRLAKGALCLVTSSLSATISTNSH
jgi:hypothetical protein